MSQEQSTSAVTSQQASAPAAVVPSAASPQATDTAAVAGGADAGAAAAADGGTTLEASAAVATRPEWLPESLWDAETNAPKADDLNALLAEHGELKAAADARKTAIPEKADGYEAKLPEDFKLPEGWEVDTADPLWAAGRELAHKNGWTQAEFEHAAQAFVGLKINEHQMIEQGAAKVREALGQNGPARIDALGNWFNTIAPDASVAQQLRESLFTPGIITAWEGVMSKLASQGVGSLGAGGDGGQQAGSIPGYDKMTFEQKIVAARAARAAGN